MSEPKLDSQGRTVDGTTDTEETRLIADVANCHQESLAKQDALFHPRQSILLDGYRELLKAAESGKAKEETARVKLKAHRLAKLSKKDLHTIHGELPI